MCLILGFGIQKGMGFVHDGVKGKDSTFEICKKIQNWNSSHIHEKNYVNYITEPILNSDQKSLK